LRSDEHVCAINWETLSNTGTDSSRFLASGALRSFWLRTKQGFLAEGLPLLRAALQDTIDQSEGELPPVIVESNSFATFLKPSLYFAVIDPAKEDSKTQRAQFSTAPMHWCSAGLRKSLPWRTRLDQAYRPHVLQEKPSVTQREGEKLPEPLQVLVRRMLEGPATISI